jgi:tRNA pseudouridine(38-40) synthase
VTAAGRTDTGVHATAQVVHFDTEAERDDNAWVRGPNACGGEALRVLWSHRVPDTFHARYSAISRTYKYLLLNDPVAPAILRNRVGWFHRPLELDRMREAAKAIVGEHDFSAFRDSQCQARSPIRNVMEATIERQDNLFVFTFRANAFLHHMIRNLVGSLVYIGARREDSDWLGGSSHRGTGSSPRRLSRRRGCTLRRRVRSGIRAARIPAATAPMTERVRIKICGLREPAHARIAADAGADAIGLVFYPPSPRFVTVEQAAAVTAALPPYVTAVGLFVNAEAHEIRRIVHSAHIDLLQFQGDEEPDFCAQFGKPFVRAVRMEGGVDLLEYARRFNAARALLLDAHVPGTPGGTGLTFDWAAIPRDFPMPLILSGGLTAGTWEAQ